MAPNFKPCPHCGQPFGSSSIDLHVKRCRFRPEVLAEAELRAEEGWARPNPNEDWMQCPNCGEPYGKVAFKGHVTKCKKLRPYGANGFGPGGGPPQAKQDADRLVKKSLRKADHMRELFDRFDTDKDGVLSPEELAACLRNCFPNRPDDANTLAAEFAKADKDGSGGVDFDEFVDYYNQLAGSASKFEEAADMFRHFDLNRDGALDRDEFRRLLQQVFPEHCDEIDDILDREFEIADADKSGGVSFDEFCAYYERLKGLFEDEEEGEEGSLEGDLVPCDGCKLTFLPSKLDAHRRGCPAVHALEDAKRATEEAEAKLAAALAELERAKDESAAAAQKAKEDEAAAKAAQDEEDARRKAAEAEAKRKSKADAEKAKRAAAEAAKAAAAKEAEDARALGLTDAFETPSAFVPCPDCGRTFFPDRLPVHRRGCSKRKPSGVRATNTDGAAVGSVYVTSVGSYSDKNF